MANEMKNHSDKAWEIASNFSGILASDTRTLAAMIDDAIAEERKRCAAIIKMRMPLYTDIGQINALKECLSSIDAALEGKEGE
jgi:hypothetical protein